MNLLARAGIGIIRVYQVTLSPLLPPMCRFYPSCSRYAVQALQLKPLHVALVLICWRLLRCNPLCRGGYDPVTDASCDECGTAHH